MGDLNQLHDASLTGDANLARELTSQALLSGLNPPRQPMGARQVLPGNLNPVTVRCKGNPETVTVAIAACHRQAGARYIVGAGGEVPRDTPAENLRALCEYAKAHQP